MRGTIWLAALCLACGSGAPTHLCDELEMLSADDAHRLARQRALIERESGVDIRIALAAASDSSIERDALALYAALGRKRDPHAILYLIRPDAIRIAIGYDIEPAVVDARAGDWIVNHLRPLHRAGDTAESLRLALRMLEEQIRRSTLSDPRRRRRFGSGGAGATATLVAARDTQSTRTLPAIAAAPTARDALDRYRAWLDAPLDRGAPLLTESSRVFLSDWPLTRGYAAFVKHRESRCQFRIIERNERAVAVCRNDSLVAPHFLVRSTLGWQVDLVAEARNVVNLSSGPFAWALRTRGDPFLVPFEDEIVDVEGFLRLQGGDHTRIPAARGPASQPRFARSCPRE